MNEIEVARKVVEEFELAHGEGESRGACHTIANRIALRLSNSKVVPGYIRMRQGDAQHWWVELNDGTLIDPLAEMWMDKPFKHIKITDQEGREKSLEMKESQEEFNSYVNGLR